MADGAQALALLNFGVSLPKWRRIMVSATPKPEKSPSSAVTLVSGCRKQRRHRRRADANREYWVLEPFSSPELYALKWLETGISTQFACSDAAPRFRDPSRALRSNEPALTPAGAALAVRRRCESFSAEGAGQQRFAAP